MARMSIDDKFLRDARVVLLGRRFGWGRRETMGALLDLFAIAYDREDDVITAAEIDVTAGEAGFADALIDVDLGERVDDGVRIKGAAERIEYLAAKREAGRRGGRKSGETRRNRREAKRSTASADREARGNPPDPVPDLPPDPVPEDQSSLPRTIPPAVPEPEPAQAVQEQQRPAGGAGPATPPSPAHEDIARTQSEQKYARESVADFLCGPKACDHVVSRTTPENMRGGDRDPTPANVILHAPAFDSSEPRAIGRLAETTWRRISDAAIALAAELKLPPPLPFPAITPSTNRAGFVELKSRIREEGELAPTVCDRVLENLVKQARSRRSVEWLAEKVFGDKAWVNARNGIDPSARAAPGRGDQRAFQPSMPTPPRFAPVVDPVISPEDRAAMLELADRLVANPDAAAVAEFKNGRAPKHLPTHELVKRFGDARAGPGSAGPHDDTPDEKPDRRRKAAK
jgi:hypothetical protein